MARTRTGGGGFDRARLTLGDIETWERRKRHLFTEYETDLLIDLDWVEPKNALGEDDGDPR